MWYGVHSASNLNQVSTHVAFSHVQHLYMPATPPIRTFVFQISRRFEDDHSPQ